VELGRTFATESGTSGRLGWTRNRQNQRERQKRQFLARFAWFFAGWYGSEHGGLSVYRTAFENSIGVGVNREFGLRLRIETQGEVPVERNLVARDRCNRAPCLRVFEWSRRHVRILINCGGGYWIAGDMIEGGGLDAGLEIRLRALVEVPSQRAFVLEEGHTVRTC